MRDILNALDKVVNDSVGMSAKQRREFNGLIKEGRQLEAESAAAHAAERAKIDNAKLPECATFVGTGTRCGACRIRKAMHA